MKRSQKNKVKTVGVRIFASVLAVIMILGSVAGALIYIFS